MEHLDGDVALELSVDRAVEGGHAADAELALHGVVVRACGGQSLGILRGHGQKILPRRVLAMW